MCAAQANQERTEVIAHLDDVLRTLARFARAVVAECVTAVKHQPRGLVAPPGAPAPSGSSSPAPVGEGAEALQTPLAALLHISKRDAGELLRSVGFGSTSPSWLPALHRVVAEGEVVVADVARACRQLDCAGLQDALLRTVALRLRAETPALVALDSVSSIASA